MNVHDEQSPADRGDDRPATKVLVAVDESEASIRAARTAYQVFGERATYFLVNVGIEQMRLGGGDPMTWGVPYPLAFATSMSQPFVTTQAFQANDMGHSDLPSAIDRAQAEARSVSTAADLPVDAVALGATGDPVEQIRQIATSESIDVIVVGSGTSSWWRHLFDPSVSKALVRQAERPVLLVP